MCSFVSKVGTSELSFTNEGKLFLLEAAFEVKNSSFFRLIVASGNDLSAALCKVYCFSYQHLKKCD